MPQLEVLAPDRRFGLEGAANRLQVSLMSRTGFLNSGFVGVTVANRQTFLNDKLIVNACTFPPAPGAGIAARAPVIVISRGMFMAECSSGAAFQGLSSTGLLMPGPLLAADVDIEAPVGYSTWRWDIVISRPAITSTLDLTGGVWVTLDNSQFSQPEGFNSAAGFSPFPPGIAVVGDGGTGYRLQVRRVTGAAPLSVDIPLVWPKAINRRVLVSFEMTAASALPVPGGRNQTYRVLLDRQPVFTLDASDPTAPLQTGLLNQMYWRPTVQASENPGFFQLLFDDWQIYTGDRRILTSSL